MRQLFFALLIGIACFGIGLIQGVSLALADSLPKTHAMSAPTIVEVFVEKESLRIQLEICVTNAPAFRDLLPTKIIQQLGYEAKENDEERLALFFQHGLVLRSDDKIMIGQVNQVELRKRLARDTITGEALLTQPNATTEVIFVEIQYELPCHSRTISIEPPKTPTSHHVTANIGFITYHCGLPVMDFRFLTQRETLNLNWDDPWYSKFTNEQLRRHIDAPMAVFVYVEPFEIRVEVILRPVDLQRWIDLDIDEKAVIPTSIQPALKDKLASFLIKHHNVEVDGSEVQGELVRANFLNRTLKKTGVIYPDRDLSALSATMGVIYSYPIAHLPQRVDLHWALFDNVIPKIPANTIDEAGGMPSELSQNQPTLTWINYLKHPKTPAMQSIPAPIQPTTSGLPLISLACLLIIMIGLGSWLIRSKPLPHRVIFACLVAVVGWPLFQIDFPNPMRVKSPINELAAKEIVGSLLKNIYHAFDYRAESTVYDKLEISLSGDILKEAYLQTRQQLEVEDQGNAKVKIDQVALGHLQIETVTSKSFQCRCSWLASGTVGHWGHIHRRAINYVAELEITAIGERWKITSLQVMDEQQKATPTPADL